MPYLGIARRARGLLQRSERTTDGSTIGSADFVRYCLSNYPISHSQILQDLFVMFWLGEPDRGYAVEFGVADGVSLSNTYLLEQRGWDTLVAEPARSAQASIRRHRRQAIDFRCVWSRSGEQLEFVETASRDLSTISDFVDRDDHSAIRAKAGSSRYLVETVSLRDLLRSHDAPRTIDYLSVDAEGSEFEILSHFDFDEYFVKVLTVEHNFVEAQRERLYELLTANGFVRVFDHLSQFEDWYLHRNTLAAIESGAR